MLWSVYSKWLDDDQVDIEQAKLESFIGQNSPGTPPKNKDRDKSLFYKGKAGAGDGNRTHVICLGSKSPTIERHPQTDNCMISLQNLPQIVVFTRKNNLVHPKILAQRNLMKHACTLPTGIGFSIGFSTVRTRERRC